MRPTASPRVGAGREASLGTLAALLLRETRTLAADYALLAVLDARRAAVSLAWLLSLALAIAVLAVTAWLAFVTGGIVWLLGSGTSWPAALGAAALLNVIAGAVVAIWARRLYRELPFAATLRQLRGEPAGTESGP